MIDYFLPHLKKIEQQQDTMLSLVKKWANINSGSENLFGLHEMILALKEDFSSLGGEIKLLPLPPRKKINEQGQMKEQPLGQALSIIKRPKAPLRVFLGGHMDTVFPADSPFQKVKKIDSKKMQGPGVIDLKGGLAIMLKALETFEESSFTHKLGWEILINPDEEIGSIGSASLFQKSAKNNHIGLIFEPSLPDGSFVSSRKGSANYTIVAHGKSSHVGRDFHLGRNAIQAMAQVVIKISNLSDPSRGIIANVGSISGGGR